MREIQMKVGRGETRLFRNNVGLFETADGRKVMTGLCKGSSDLIGWTIKEGRAIFVALEVKTAKGRPTKEQLNFIDKVNEAGGIAGIVRSVEEAKELLK